MKIVGAVIGLATVLGGSVGLAATPAEAAVLQCISSSGQGSMLIEDAAACGTGSALFGTAAAYGIDGVGYANANGPAYSIGAGVAGGVGASEGASGVLSAIGIGPDAVAITSADDRSLSIAVAFVGSRAIVAGEDAQAQCIGAAAIAWNAHTGRGCISTAFGTFGIG